MKAEKIRIHYFLLILCVLSLSFASCSDDSEEIAGETIQDVDGNVYHTVTIGSQVWMVENLKTTKFRNGEPIPYIEQDSIGIQVSYGGYCNYGDDNSIANKYGRLYNWLAVRDERKIAPEGWHIPTEDEWNTLANYAAANVGTAGSAAKILAAQTDWVSFTEVGTVGNDLSTNNSTGFTALPGGARGESGSYQNIGESAMWWSNENYIIIADEYLVPFRYIDFGGNDNSGELDSGLGYPSACFSVRCIKD